MFGLFGKSPPWRDDRLGELKRERGWWRGTTTLPAFGAVPLALGGDRAAPDPRAVAAAQALPDQFAALRPELEAALHEHYAPYRHADDGDAGDAAVPTIASPADVWPHVRCVFASVEPASAGALCELGLAVAWDEEHTLGARLQDGRLVELNGSVLAP